MRHFSLTPPPQKKKFYKKAFLNKVEDENHIENCYAKFYHPSDIIM